MTTGDTGPGRIVPDEALACEGSDAGQREGNLRRIAEGLEDLGEEDRSLIWRMIRALAVKSSKQ